jgi:hypothetical protein
MQELSYSGSFFVLVEVMAGKLNSDKVNRITGKGKFYYNKAIRSYFFVQ